MYKISFVIILSLLSFIIKGQGVISPVLDTQQLAVIPFDYSFDSSQQTVAELEEGFFTSDYSIKKFIEEISYGKASLSGTVYPYRTDQPYFYGTGYTNCFPDDSVMANQPDVDYTTIDGVTLMVHDTSKRSCSAGAGSTGKLSFKTKDGTYDFRRNAFRLGFYLPNDFSKTSNSTIAQEMMHSLGIPYHSDSYIKVDGEYKLQNRGDLFSILGSGSQSSHPCALVKKQLGWLTDNEMETVTKTDTFRLYPLEQNLPGQTQCLIVDLPVDIDLQPNDGVSFSKLYLEYRGMTGFDTRANRFVNLKDGNRYTIWDVHGLLIYGIDCQSNNDYCIPVLIDVHTEPFEGVGASYKPHEAADAQLKWQEKYYVQDNTISFEVVMLHKENYLDVLINLDDNMGINDERNNSFTIYPNPANENINIEYNGSSFTVEIYDIYGRFISSHKNNKHIDIRNLCAGIYMLQLQDVETQKIRIERIVIQE